MALSFLLAALLAQAVPAKTTAAQRAATANAQARAAGERAAVAAERVASAVETAAAAAQKAAEAAAQAALAAQRAAESAQRSAEAIEKMSPPRAAAAAVAASAVEARPADAIAPPKPADPAAPVWTGTVGLGLIALTGNSQTITFSTNAALQRKSEYWIWGIAAAAAYGQNTAAGAASATVTALAASLQARGDRRFTDALSLYLLGGVDTDHLKSIEDRPYGEVGVSILWFDEKIEKLEKSSFKTDLGFRYGHEYRFLYYGAGAPAAQAGVNIVAPRVGASYRYAVNKDIIFTEDASALGNLVDQTRLIATSVSKLSSRLTEKVALGVSFAVQYDSAPPPLKVNTDTALTVGLEIGL